MRRILLLTIGLAALAGCEGSTGSTDPAERGPDAALRGDAGTGDAGLPPGHICAVGESRCVDGLLRTCLEDGTGWLAERCGEASACLDGACVDLVCAPGARECVEGGVRTCAADGAAWSEPTPCDAGETCLEGVCLEPTCTVGETACADKVLLTCDADGIHWTRTPCAAGEQCVNGACRRVIGGGDCPAGEVLCGPEGIFECGEDGTSWIETPCAEGEACFQGRCVACVRDADCADGGACDDGRCVAAPLAVATDELPPGQVGAEYAFQLEAVNGTPPYRWSLADGELPRGLALVGEGALSGTPLEAGERVLRFAVQDEAGARAEAELRLRVHGEGLVISTDRLPAGEEGDDYAVQFEAVGGEAPYGWFIVEGALPAGLALGADGRLAGTPTEVGSFDFRLRAVDASTPPAFAEKDFRLEVRIAPLRVTGDQMFDLFITKVVVLPTITVVPNIPIPYDTRLQARGGLRPYHWREEPLDPNLARFVPQSGIPDGLVLEEDGRLHGAVVDPAQIISVTIPFTMIELTGFFFVGRVADSQDVPVSDQAIFLLPTLPIGG